MRPNDVRCSRGGRFNEWRRGGALALVFGLSVLACQRDERPSVPGTAAAPSSGTGGLGGGGVGGAGSGGLMPSEGGAPDLIPCNAWPALCDRPYDEIVHPVAHAAMANLSPPWDHPAQRYSLYRQLQAGIRGLMLEVHDRNGAVTFCLGSCEEGHVPFSSGLDEVAMFLDSNPREVVTVIVDNRVPATEIADALVAHALDRYLHGQEPGAPWPTLSEMIEAGERLVVFAFDAPDPPNGILPFWSFAASTRADAASRSELDCDLVRGGVGDSLMLLNHYVSAPAPASDSGEAGGGGAGGEAGTGEGGSRNPTEDALARRALPEEAAAINVNPFLIQRLRACVAEHARKPTFVAVDFYDQGDVLAATQELNELIPPSGS